MLLNSFPDDLYVFRDCLHLGRLGNCFPSPLVSWCFCLFERDVDSSGCASLSVWWVEWYRHFIISLSHLGIKNGLSELWPRGVPALHERCFRCRWWQNWGEMSPCQKVCPVFAQTLTVLVEFAGCSVQSSCLLSGCHATGCWHSGWPFKARWAWGWFNSGLLPWRLSFLYFKGEVSCSSHLTQWDQGVFVFFHHTGVTLSPCCISNSDNGYGYAYSVWK